MTFADLVYWSCIVYGVLGLANAVAFLTFGLDRIDAAARGAFAFRPLLCLGLVLLWPLVIAKWRRLYLRST